MQRECAVHGEIVVRASNDDAVPCRSELAREKSPGHRSITLCTLAMAISLAGCSGLPDQRLANEALKRGDTTVAEQNYRQLADLGYTEAQVGLADIQVESRDPAQIKLAEATYRAAADTSPRAQARLGRLLVAKPGASEAEHREAEGLLKKAFANGEGNTLIALAMLYLQFPQSFPDVNAQQQISQWRSAGYPEAGLAQVLLYRTQNTYDQHLDEVEKDLQGRTQQQRHLLRRTGHRVPETCPTRATGRPAQATASRLQPWRRRGPTGRQRRPRAQRREPRPAG